ncbi:unnamed protein product [Microthlaspi erraticum]|uniref:Uncharacterized protein n=1 Tax=Microthlaspi erraticum TaxID=1685480 RepID=A0A6D2J783_9BRAS|nr:unnamed protein product [Microthlaspi erraticum]
MVEVKSTDEEGAWVTLLEYNNMEGRIVQTSCCRRTVVGRIEAAVVREITVSKGEDGERKVLISLERDGFLEYERRICEVRFLRRKFIDTILRKVATSFERSDDSAANLAQLPSFAALSSRRFLKTLSRRLRRELRKALETVKYESWRMGGILKLKKLLPIEKHLSVQDLINKTPNQSDEGDLTDLIHAVKILQNIGIVTEDECPLTLNVPTPEERARFRKVVTGTEYKAKSATVVFYDWHLGIEDIKSFLDDESPVTASIIWFNSYAENNPGGVDIYKPTDEEWRAYRVRPSSRSKMVHTMLLTGSGVDENGVPYWEFMDDKGNVGNGDRGFLRIIQYPGIIIEYVDIQV